MRKYSELLEKYELKPRKYEMKGKVTVIDTDQGKFVLKPKERNQNGRIYEYLDSRNFNYYPKIFSDMDDAYDMTEYIEKIDLPNDQKIMDMIDLVGLLHSKTNHYKEVDEDDYKKIYEDLNGNIQYLRSYYNDIMTIIEATIYMSPSQYLLARNISKIYGALDYCSSELETWYELIKQKTKQRVVVLHNNLELNHFIRNHNSYLINWEKAKIDLPIFDFYKLYRKHGLDFEFSELLKRYEGHYPLLKEERILLFILMALPNKIEFDQSEYAMCRVVSKEIDLIFKTEKLVSPYYTEKGKNQQ